jgi:hypothetical protein
MVAERFACQPCVDEIVTVELLEDPAQVVGGQAQETRGRPAAAAVTRVTGRDSVSQ